MGVITLDPKNPQIVYVGTGDPEHAGGAGRGFGMLRSSDGGNTWDLLGAHQFANRGVTSIVVDPRTAGSTNATVYVATAEARSGGSTTGE